METDLNNLNKRGTGKKFLIFTSAGDSSNHDLWLSNNSNFDVFVCYYGEKSIEADNRVTYLTKRKGSKFQNLHHYYNSHRPVFENYDVIAVADDDIVISAKEIDAIFSLHQREDLWISQPSFSPRGKVSHEITQQSPHCQIRFTNFVEMTIPFFSKQKLFEFLDAYDPKLIGWGSDWFFLEVIGNKRRKRVAIFDSISCVNPFDNTKLRGREIDNLQSTSDRHKAWEELKAERGLTLENRGYVLYSWRGCTSLRGSLVMIVEKLKYELKALKGFLERLW